MNRLASPPWNKHNLNKTNLGSNSVINLTTHTITFKQIFQYHLGSIDTVSFQRTTREGLHSITQLQLAPSIEHQIAAMFSILVRCLDIPSLLSTCLSILVVHLSSKIESLTYLTMQTIQGVPIWDYLKRARAALCFDFIRNIFWDTLSFWKHRSGYLKSLSWFHKMMIMVYSNDDHCINMVTS